MTKKEIRNDHIKQMQQLDGTQKQAQEKVLMEKLFATSAWQDAQTVAVTMSQSFEFDTEPLIQAAKQAGKSFLVPRTLPKRQMEFVLVDDQTEFEKTKFGLLEPKNGQVLTPNEIDLIVVPGVAFTKTGKRLGFGGGYYDRYLAKYDGATVSLRLSSQVANDDDWPTEAFDVQIKQVIAFD